MELGGSTLKDTIDHEHIAGKDFILIRLIASKLGSALDDLHFNGGIHAGFKPPSVIDDGYTWKIIDLDVFCKVDQPFGKNVPSSGYCPPEMARVLLRAMDDQNKVDGAKLAEYKASVAYDLWSFGAVLYNLCFGIPLWKTDSDDNVTPEDLRTLASLPDTPLKSRIRKALGKGLRSSATTDLKTAADLLLKLLEPDEHKRLANFYELADSPMKSVLEEPFFRVQGLDVVELAAMTSRLDAKLDLTLGCVQDMDTKLDKLINMNEEHRTELQLTRKTLMKSIFEATEVKTPTTFIILDKVLPPELSEEEQDQPLMSLEDDDSGIELTGNLEAAKERLDKTTTWLKRLKTFATVVAKHSDIEVFDKIKEVFGELITKETMYFYLVDELTGLPVRDKPKDEGGIYPIEITKPKEIVHKLMPLMQVGIHAVSLYNGAAGVARLIGYPMPLVPEKWRKGAQSSVDLLKQARI